MKKHLLTTLIILCITLFFSACQSKYTEGVAMPENYPAELVVYDDAVVFESLAEDDKITITYGTIDNIDDIAEFYEELSENMDFIFEESEEEDDSYEAQGVGTYYNFEIKAEKPRSRREFKHYDTVVTVTIVLRGDDNELMDKMQGNWLYIGIGGTLEHEKYRDGVYFVIDEYSFDYYNHWENESKLQRVFYLGDSRINAKSDLGEIKSYNVVFETIDGVAVMTLEGSPDYIAQHYVKVTDEELAMYLSINEMCNKMNDFWQRVDGDYEENEYIDFAYDISQYRINIYHDAEIYDLGVDYDFVDADTIKFVSRDVEKEYDIVFSDSADGEQMQFISDEEVIFFEKTTKDEYKQKVINRISAETYLDMQGMWQLAGSDGQIPDARSEQGFAYEFTEYSMNVYSNYLMTDFGVSFKFIDENTIEYVIEGETKTAQIVFENIAGYDVLTFKDASGDYHFIETTADDFNSKTNVIVFEDEEYDCLYPQYKGFWMQIGSSGSLNDADKNQGNAIFYDGMTMRIYMGFELYLETTDFEFTDENTLVFNLSTGRIKAKLEFKTVDETEVLCAVILFKEYYFVSSSLDEFMQYGEDK